MTIEGPTFGRQQVNPNHGKWVCYLFGSKPGDKWAFSIRPLEGNVPNWFHRQVHNFLLGFKWVKEKI